MDDNLVSANKLRKDIKAMKLLSLLLKPNMRSQITEMESQLNHMIHQIKLFNNRFSDSGWCAYDSMSLTLIEKANKAFETDGIDLAEKVLINYYQNDVKDTMHWLKYKSEEFAVRYDLLQKAFDEHFAKRYFSSIPLFLIIIDGAVNDFTQSKGFFAEGTDVTAWDCLVGCDEGLAKLKTIFNTGRNKTNVDEIRMPYRNGVLHGRDLNYGNEYVSCKCVALIYAVVDWMHMKKSEGNRKANYEKEINPPPLRESFAQMRRNARDRSEIEKWKPRNVQIGEDIPSKGASADYELYGYIKVVVEAFEAWSNQNYGLLSILLKNMFPYEKSSGKRAGECRQLFEGKKFLSFEIMEVEERACSLSRVLAKIKWEDKSGVYEELLEFGCVFQTVDGKAAYPWRDGGKWIIMPWNVQGLYK